MAFRDRLWFHPLDSRRASLTVLGGALILGLAFQGTRGLYETSEGRYAEVAREMLERHDLLTPALHYVPHWTKPPFTYWAIAAGLKLLGLNTWGARLAAGLALPLATLGVLGAGRRLYGARGGLWAAACFCTMPFTVFAANTLTTDIFLTAWTALATWAFAAAHGPSGTGRSRAAARAFFWLCVGMAFLTKGPPALLFLIPLSVWHARHKPPCRLFTAGGLAVFAVAGLGWYLLMAYRTPGLLRIWVFGELTDRMLSGSSHNDEWYKASYIYFVPLIFGMGGWLWFAGRAAVEHKAHRLRVLAPLVWRDGAAGRLLFWIAITLAILTISSSKLELYALPLTIPTALLVGLYLKGRPRMDRAAARVFAVSWVLLLVLKGSLSLVPHDRDMDSLAQACREATGNPRAVALVPRDKLNGLQFYLDGRVERYAEKPTPDPQFKGTLSDMLSRIEHAEDLDALAFVGSPRQARTLAGASRASDLQVAMRDWHEMRIVTFRRRAEDAQRQ